jgi:hypothetical protein
MLLIYKYLNYSLTELRNFSGGVFKDANNREGIKPVLIFTLLWVLKQGVLEPVSKHLKQIYNVPWKQI